MEGFKEFYNGHSDNEIIGMYLGNKSISEISSVTQKSIGEIYRILHANQIRPNRLKTNHNNVRDFASSGMTISQIAELTGYTPRNIRYILTKLKTENDY